MTRPYFPESTDSLADAIAQADWLAAESAYPTAEDLWLDDPDLFTDLASGWRETHPLDTLGS